MSKLTEAFRTTAGRSCWVWVSILIAAILLTTDALAERAGTKSDRQMERLTRWLQSKNDAVRLDAVNELVKSRRPECIPLLMEAGKDTNAQVRAAVAWSAWDPVFVPQLRGMLADENEYVRASAAWSISQLGGKAVLADIVKLARQDPSRVVRFRAVWGLGRIRDQSALPVVIDALGDENVSVRERSALMALESLADSTVPSRLLKLTSHAQPDTRRLVMYLLARYGDKTVVPALKEGLKDSDPLVRGEAALSLGKLRAAGALDALALALKDPDEHVRGSAAYAVGLLGDKAAVPALQPLLKDETAFVRAVTAESLQRLGDKSARPPEGFRAAELFTFPIYSPEHVGLYR